MYMYTEKSNRAVRGVGRKGGGGRQRATVRSGEARVRTGNA